MAPQIRLDIIWHSPIARETHTHKKSELTQAKKYNSQPFLLQNVFGRDQGFITNARTFQFSHSHVEMELYSDVVRFSNQSRTFTASSF